MGKIVKSGKVNGEKYVVAVPRIDLAQEQHAFAAGGELDDRFAAPFGGNGDPFDHLNGNAAIAEAAPEVTPEPQIDWDALKADAEAIVDRAAADARALIEEAQRAARQIYDEAEARAQSIEVEARTRGYDAGFETGKNAADVQMGEMIDTMHGLLGGIRDSRQDLMESAEPEIVRLAMAIAERIVHEQITVDPNVVIENVRSALTRLAKREVVTLRVNPADLETMRHHRDAVVSASDIEQLRIVEDQRVDRGGVVVETEAGTIDAKISTQLREARRVIRAEDGISLGASAEEVLHPSAQAS